MLMKTGLATLFKTDWKRKILEVERLIASYYVKSKRSKCLNCNDSKEMKKKDERDIHYTGGMDRIWFDWCKRGGIRIVEGVFNLETK